jgi:hypothetical protein
MTGWIARDPISVVWVNQRSIAIRCSFSLDFVGYRN